MHKYAKVIQFELGRVDVSEQPKDGYTLMKVLQSDIDNLWYKYDMCKFKSTDDKLKELQTYLTEEVNFVAKSNIAYTGVLFDYKGKELVFETNKDSITLITSTLLKISQGTQIIKDWKCRETIAPYEPVSIDFTAIQFMQFVAFGQAMIAQAFAVESAINEKIKALDYYYVTDDTIAEMTKQINDAYKSIPIKLEGVI